MTQAPELDLDEVPTYASAPVEEQRLEGIHKLPGKHAPQDR